MTKRVATLLLSFMLLVNASTLHPTLRPTARPTPWPTAPPTVDPFVVITFSPTAKKPPSRKPSFKPTIAYPTMYPSPSSNDSGGGTQPSSTSSGKGGGGGQGDPKADPFANRHNQTLLAMVFMSIAMGATLCYFRRALYAFVRRTAQTTTYSLVHFSYVDSCVTIPISIMTAIANFTLISALYLDADDASSLTREVDRSLASAMVGVRVVVACVSVYLIDSSIRRDVWKQFVLVDYLDFPFSAMWAVFILIMIIDPSQVRFLPFMKSPFSEHSGGYPNLNVFLICMCCTIISSLAIFIVSAASMVYIPLSEVIVSTVLSGMWFVVITTITILRLARPVDVDEILTESAGGGAAGGGAAGGGMQSHPKGAYRNYHGDDHHMNHNPQVPSFSTYATGNPLVSGDGLEMRSSRGSAPRIDEILLSGSRAATRPIRAPTPPKRIGLGAVLDNIPEPMMPLEDAKVASYAHIVYEQQQQQEQEQEQQQGVGEEELARRTFVSSDKVSQRVPFSFNYNVYDEPEQALDQEQGQGQDQDQDEGAFQRAPFS